MPLTINVGLSQKAAKDYQSTGTSINLTAELDQSLLARPEELQKQIAELYSQARAALRHQAESPTTQSAAQGPASDAAGSGNHCNGDCHCSEANAASSQWRSGPGGRSQYASGQSGSTRSSASGNGKSAPGTMTNSQSRAIAAIAKRIGVDPSVECQNTFGWTLDKLSIRQASEMIDHLNSLSAAGAKEQ